MRHFKGKVAVVTGGASGIGLAMARRFAHEGMRVVIADVEVNALAAAERELRGNGATAIGVRTDVSRSHEVEALAADVLNAFGGVHILCNNAGVAGTPGTIWDRSLDELRWVIGVNLWGVIHGIRTFIPIMLKQGEDGHVVNTASIGGLLSGPFLGMYAATKHAVVSISEVLYAELAAAEAPIGVSVLCPGFVKTRIMESARNRPAEVAASELSSAAQAWEDGFRRMVEAGISPEAVAERVLEAIREKKLYILTHSEFNEPIRKRTEAILASSNAASQPQPPNTGSPSQT